MIKATLHRRRTRSRHLIAFDLPEGFDYTIEPLLQQSAAKNEDYLTVSFSLPFRGRSTGEGSQNHAINGGLGQIFEQSGASDQMTFDTFRAWMKLRMFPAWPAYFMPDEKVIPKSEADLSVEEAGAVISWLKVFAAENGYTLKGFQE